MQVTSTDGVRLALHDLGGTGPTVLIAHATGFCGGAYGPLAARLAPHHRVWALDFRAHGQSTCPDDGAMSWHGMANDVAATIDAIGGGPVLAYGHSMGGAALMAAELSAPGTLRAAVLFEPIIIPAAWGEGPGTNTLADGARRRRATFGSRVEALERYASRPPLGTFRADALHAYVTHGFGDDPAGTVTLRCSPEHEAQVFEAPGKPQIDQMAAVETPTLVVRGDRDGEFGPAGLARLTAAALPNCELRHHHHLSHFGPFQDPDTLADEALEFFAQN